MACPNHRYSVAECRANPLRVRFMDPTQGRFLGLDPYSGNQQNPLSFNKYLYCHGDPVNFWDPTGRDGELISTVKVVGAVGAFAGLGYAAYLGVQLYAARNQMAAIKLGLNIDQPLSRGKDPGSIVSGSFRGVEYVRGLYPDSVADDSTFRTLQMGCVGLLRIRLGIHTKRSLILGQPWLEVPGSRGFMDFDDARQYYDRLKAAGSHPWLYAVQRDPDWRAPTSMNNGTSEIRLDQTLEMPSNDFNFVSLLHLRSGELCWEYMPNGAITGGNTDLEIIRRTFDPTKPTYGLLEELYGYHPSNVFVVSPTCNEGMLE